MAVKASPWTEKFLEMVQQGPVEKELAIATVAGLVPPGHAWRVYERTMRGNAKKRGYAWEEDRKLTPSEEGVRSGQRQIVVQSFNQLKSRGRIEQYEDGGRTMFRFLRDRIVIKGEEKAAIVRATMAATTPEQRSEWSRRANASRTPEERSESARKGWLNKTPEQRAEIIKKGLEAQPPEERAASIRAGWAKVPPDKRTERAKRGWAHFDEEARRRRALKGAETRRRRAWFREGTERKDASVPSGTARRVQPDQHGREGRAEGDHEDSVG